MKLEIVAARLRCATTSPTDGKLAVLHDHSPDANELEFIERLKEVTAFEYAPIRVTATMVEKSIIDANGLVIHLLRSHGIVDFDTIPKEGSTRLDMHLISSYGLDKKDVNFYRPKHKAGRPGDPIIWPKDSKQLLDIDKLLLVGASDGPPFLLSMAGDEELVLQQFISFAKLHGLLKKKARSNR